MSVRRVRAIRPQNDAAGFCPHCDRASHEASRIGLCPPCFRATYRDAVALIESTDALAAMRQHHADHAGQVEPGLASAGDPGWVYFFQRGDRVKIGWSREPSERVRAFGAGALLATMPGFMADERALHARFELLRLEGEWFAYTPALADYISKIAAEAA